MLIFNEYIVYMKTVLAKPGEWSLIANEATELRSKVASAAEL